MGGFPATSRRLDKIYDALFSGVTLRSTIRVARDRRQALYGCSSRLRLPRVQVPIQRHSNTHPRINYERFLGNVIVATAKRAT